MTDALLKKNLIPDPLLRLVIRRLLKNRLKHERCSTAQEQQEKLTQLIEELKRSPIAVNTQDANRQHYEVPTRFFEIVLGPWLKYSCGYWPEKSTSLAQSEEKMLELTLERAGIDNGQKVLDLGCGWGSFTLFAADKYPDAQFTAVSNSASQRRFIEKRATELKLKNIKVITADINDFNPDDKYDRVVSVEMFEHVRNYQLLFSRINHWLRPEGKLFVHIFNHHKHAYKFEVRNERDWMARHFFTGGMMPSNHLLFYFSGGFSISGHWIVNGIHYSKTLEAWLKNMDSNKPEIMVIFNKTYGDLATQFWAYWRIFFMACSETFKMHRGNEWQVGHYLFEKN
jgi:cyclopropane-fatty-acyl-phospholipid synthase